MLRKVWKDVSSLSTNKQNGKLRLITFTNSDHFQPSPSQSFWSASPSPSPSPQPYTEFHVKKKAVSLSPSRVIQHFWFGPIYVVNGCRMSGTSWHLHDRPPQPRSRNSSPSATSCCAWEVYWSWRHGAKRGWKTGGISQFSAMDGHHFPRLKKSWKWPDLWCFPFRLAARYHDNHRKTWKNTSISRRRVNWIHLTWSPKIRMNSVGLAATKIETWTVGLKMCGRVFIILTQLFMVFFGLPSGKLT